MALMTIEQLIEEIEVYIDNCRTTGVLGGGSMIKVNREELLAMLDELKEQLPKEVNESKRIVNTRESIISEAKEKADRIVKEAASDASGMIDTNEITALANMRAQEIIDAAERESDEKITQAQETARTISIGALQYTQNMLDGLEDMYKSMVEQERTFFDSVITKLKEDHKQVLEDKREIDLQLSQGRRTTRSKEDFEKKSDSE